jgi:phosphoribosylanthranilate isomerase
VNGERASVILRPGMVKICGLREPVHAAVAATAGADLLGFIFAPARRQVTAATARACIEAAREAAGSRSILTVGVFVDASAAEIESVAREAGLDLVQLHGAEKPAFLETLSVPVTKALRPRNSTVAADVLAEIEAYRCAKQPPVGFLIDAYAEGAAGGTGVRADWDLAAEVSAAQPVILAGGLDSRNVGAAIRQVNPLGVDVSSGVEINGIKDAALIEGFIREAKAAFLA